MNNIVSERALHSFMIAVALLASLTNSGLADSFQPDNDGFKSRIRPFVTKFCIKCHGSTVTKGDTRLDRLDADWSDEGEAKLWDHILKKLKRDEMPPEGELQPSASSRKALTDWIGKQLRRHAIQAGVAKSPPTVRRLTNFEYQNTMRDLLGIDLNLSRYLIEDPAKPYRFNNNARFLLMGLEQLSRYEGNARRAMASVIVAPARPKPFKARMEWGPQLRRPTSNEIAVSGNRRGSPQGGLKITSWPKTGEYRIRVKAFGRFPLGITKMPLRLVMGYPLAGDIGNAPFEPVGTIGLSEGQEPKIYEFRGRIENHPSMPMRKQRRGGTRTGRLQTIPANMVITPQNLFDDGTLNDRVNPMTKPRAVVEWIEFEAPVTDVWPPAHHTRILFPSPLRKSDPSLYVKQVLKRFLTRAFRRPVTSDEVARYEKIYKIFSADVKTLEEAMRPTLAVALTSPNFLYLTVAQGEANRHFEVASRLSYFLWGSMPDQQLFTLAAKKRLLDPEVIKSQVKRMMKDRRAEDFIRNFTTQWLSIAKMRTVPINRSLFPRFLHTVNRGERSGAEVPFRPTIRDDMMNETVAFIAELVRRNADVLQIVDSDFAMLNQRLAKHYGVAGVQGHALRPVPVKPEHHLGGLLTHGSVLIGNSTGSAPHPIYRAVWLREAILGDHVKDPPADVPALADSAGASAESAVTIKDLLRLHRKKSRCNECHARLDPWGIPFERYNAIGRYQPMVPKAGVRIQGFNKTKHKDLEGYAAYVNSLNAVSVQAQSKVPHGPKINGLPELKQFLLQHRKDVIAENVIRRLLTYGLGRELTYRDRHDVEDLLEQSRKAGYRWQDIIVLICQSDTFLGKKRK